MSAKNAVGSGRGISTSSHARRIAALADVNTSWPEHLKALNDDAHSRGVKLWVYKVGDADEIVSAIELDYLHPKICTKRVKFCLKV
jgi:hypothetical protein